MPRLAPPEFGQASPARFRAEAEFHIGVEHRFFAGMQRLLRDELGVQAPVVGTADHSDRTPAYAHSATPSRFGAAVPY